MLQLETRSSIVDLPLERVIGLRPKSWLIVGSGYSREELKALVLAQGQGFIADAVSTVQELCLKIVHLSSDQLLSAFAREEVLRLLLSDSRISSGLTELKKFRRQRDLMKRLDLSLQSGRLAFAHSEEESVYEERITQSLGDRALRREVSALARAYEAWMLASGYYDLPLLMRKATQLIQDAPPSHFKLPQEIQVLSMSTPESLERQFWDVLSRWVQVTRRDPSKKVSHPQQEESFEEGQGYPPSFSWKRWHTLDDAVEAYADALVHEFSQKGNRVWDEHALLIPDYPEVRRSLKRAFESRKLPFAESRDPTLLKWEEKVKWATLPLEVVARNFERTRVLAWLRSFRMQEKFGVWTQEIQDRGIRFGMSSYAGGELDTVHLELKNLHQSLGGRRTCQEIADAHLEFLRTHRGDLPEDLILLESFEGIWKNLVQDQQRVGQAHRKAPLLYWLDHLQYRLSSASPPIEPLKSKQGLRVYRLQQAPWVRTPSVSILALPSRWLSTEGEGDYWWSERERELLSTEFAVRSSISDREEKLRTLTTWIQHASTVTLLDAEFDSGGKERESILPLVRELEMSSGLPHRSTPQDQGVHPRFAPSYQVLRPSQPVQVHLSPFQEYMNQSQAQLSASLIDRMSRCSLQAMAFYRWKLQDLSEPDTELRPEVRGRILHEAVRLLKVSTDPSGQMRLTPEEALARAWKTKGHRGLLKSQRVENYIQSRLLHILRLFCVKEAEYVDRSGTHCLALDDLRLSLEYPGLSVIGTPDRVDQHEDGIFIMDYKSSGALPHGSEMIEHGYRLQLPVYALAAFKRFQQPVLGVQFIELDRKGGRKSGIHFKKYNGKEKGCLSTLRSNSKSLIDADPESVWSLLEQHMLSSAQQFLRGEFYAQPHSSSPQKECAQCRVADLCGLRRRVESTSEDGVNS